MKDSSMPMVGAIIGLSIVFGMIVVSDRDLKKEATDQVRTVLKTTRKLIRYYTNATRMITDNGQNQPAQVPEEYNQSWDNIPTREA